MAFRDIRLPVGLSFGAQGGPSFRTDIVVTNSGNESRNQVWAYERMQYECSYDARYPVDWQTMHAFFRAVRGSADSFRARDPLDYSATTAEGLFVATADPTEWQMVKVYTFGAVTFQRKITKPVNGSATAAAGTIDYATGIVTHGSMPASWSGQFDVHARFATDEMRMQLIDRAGAEYIAGWQAIPIIEVRA